MKIEFYSNGKDKLPKNILALKHISKEHVDETGLVCRHYIIIEFEALAINNIKVEKILKILRNHPSVCFISELP